MRTKPKKTRPAEKLRPAQDQVSLKVVLNGLVARVEPGDETTTVVLQKAALRLSDNQTEPYMAGCNDDGSLEVTVIVPSNKQIAFRPAPSLERATDQADQLDKDEQKKLALGLISRLDPEEQVAIIASFNGSRSGNGGGAS
ncbi:hypothetical protein OAS39_12800 [Pirellulales bacterium]|nr:hypothetical protein [Pirellulales bacterium]